MAKQKIYCPTCYSPVSTANAFEGITVCACGEVVNVSSRRSGEGFSTSFWLVAITVMIMGGFLHAINWDTYSLEIIPLKVKQAIGKASYSEQKRVAEICLARKKFNCQETALLSAFALNPKDTDSLKAAADIQFSRGAYKDSTKTYAYLLKATNAEEIRYDYAKSLAKSGNLKDAKKQLHFLVFSRSKNPQVSAARTYVEILMQSKDYVTAKQVISHTRTRGEYTAMFLNKEFKYINQMLSKNRYAKAP